MGMLNKPVKVDRPNGLKISRKIPTKQLMEIIVLQLDSRELFKGKGCVSHFIIIDKDNDMRPKMLRKSAAFRN